MFATHYKKFNPFNGWGKEKMTSQGVSGRK